MLRAPYSSRWTGTQVEWVQQLCAGLQTKQPAFCSTRCTTTHLPMINIHELIGIPMVCYRGGDVLYVLRNEKMRAVRLATHLQVCKASLLLSKRCMGPHGTWSPTCTRTPFEQRKRGRTRLWICTLLTYACGTVK